MVETWTKLMSSILDSSVWCYDNSTKIVWITLMAMADKNGIIHGAIPGIARRAGVTTEEARRAMEIFQQPDPDSRSQDHEGKRVERQGRDWKLLNHGAIRELGRHEAELARKRKWWNENRGKEAMLDDSSASARPIQMQNAESDSDPNSEAYSDPDPSPKKNKKKKAAYTEPFLCFWDGASNIVSNPGNKFQAQKAWTAQSKTGGFPSCDELIGHLVRQDIERRALTASGGFVPNWVHMSTWLNNRGWETVYQVEKNPPPEPPRRKTQTEINRERLGYE